MKKFFGLVFAVALLAGCSGQKASETETVADGQISVVASFYPLAYMTERIAGDVAAIKSIVGAADPDDYSLSPSDITAMNRADLVILQGAEFEPWGDDIATQLSSADVPVIEVASSLTLMKADNAHEDEHNHAHGEFDPHTWLDPALAGQMVDVIASALIDAAPAYADDFRANAAALKKDFADLDTAYSRGLAQCTQNEVIISHDAFGYVAAKYSFTTHAIAGLSTQDEPSAETLAELKKIATQEGITYILTEENAITRFSETLASETGLTMLPINPLATPADDHADFFDRARANLSQLAIALECSA